MSELYIDIPQLDLDRSPFYEYAKKVAFKARAQFLLQCAELGLDPNDFKMSFPIMESTEDGDQMKFTYTYKIEPKIYPPED